MTLSEDAVFVLSLASPTGLKQESAPFALAAGVDWELSRGLPPVGSKLIDRDSEWEDHKTRWTVADPIA